MWFCLGNLCCIQASSSGMATIEQVMLSIVTHSSEIRNVSQQTFPRCRISGSVHIEKNHMKFDFLVLVFLDGPNIKDYHWFFKFFEEMSKLKIKIISGACL